MYMWHSKNYVGGAHGTAGILYVLLQVSKLQTKYSIFSLNFFEEQILCNLIYNGDHEYVAYIQNIFKYRPLKPYSRAFEVKPFRDPLCLSNFTLLVFNILLI